mmetsp:Transcript_12884/g.43951  ORF Transcript_12884/g.43951 Transcript_12884/m.43951 type:complete len:254 (+) Transcript_12884:153-914(+)
MISSATTRAASLPSPATASETAQRSKSQPSTRAKAARICVRWASPRSLGRRSGGPSALRKRFVWMTFLIAPWNRARPARLPPRGARRAARTSSRRDLGVAPKADMTLSAVRVSLSALTWFRSRSKKSSLLLSVALTSALATWSPLGSVRRRSTWTSPGLSVSVARAPGVADRSRRLTRALRASSAMWLRGVSSSTSSLSKQSTLSSTPSSAPQRLMENMAPGPRRPAPRGLGGGQDWPREIGCPEELWQRNRR